MAQSRRENFPVASRLLPRRARAHLLAIYGFARLVDDIGDEAPGDRLALLDEVQADLLRVWDGSPRLELLVALQPTVRDCRLPIEPFAKLIEANRRDQVVSRYETWDELMDYCALSANPVGELVLRVFDLASSERLALSDRVCSALQVVEHLQDVGEDRRAGRIYLPRVDRQRFGVAEDDLDAAVASAGVRSLVAYEAARARALLDEGSRLVRTLRGRPALAVAAFIAGGRAALKAIERAEHDVLARTTRPAPRTLLAELLATIVGA